MYVYAYIYIYIYIDKDIYVDKDIYGDKDLKHLGYDTLSFGCYLCFEGPCSIHLQDRSIHFPEDLNLYLSIFWMKALH